MQEASNSWIDRRGLAVALLVGFFMRCIALALHVDDLTFDRDAYLGIAQGVTEGRGLCSPGSSSATAFRPPLYPMLLGLLQIGFPSGFAVAVINVASGLLTVWATKRVGDELNLGWGSLIAAMLVAIDPMLSRYTPQPMTETLCTALVALLLLTTVSRNRKGERREWCVGVLFGLLVMCRPTFWPLAGLALVMWGATRVMAAWNSNSNQVAASKMSSLPWRVIAGTLLVVAPWAIRNQIVMGVPLLSTTHGGYTLLLANNPVFYDQVVDQPWGTVWEGGSLSRWQSELNARLEEELGPHASEWERDRRQNVLAREFISAHPGRFLKAMWHRIRSLWSPVPLGELSGGPPWWLIEAVRWYYIVTLMAFAVGVIVVARHEDRWRWWLPLALLVTVQGVHLVYWTNARMRAPLTPTVALFAAVSLKRASEVFDSQWRIE